MPRKGSINPTALPTRIMKWLHEHPGEHRARDIAVGLGVPEDQSRAGWSQKVANALARLARDKAVDHHYRDIGHAKPVGHYSSITATTAGTRS